MRAKVTVPNTFEGCSHPYGMQVADFFADRGTMKHLARLLGLRLNRALAGQPDGSRSSLRLTAAQCYGVRAPNQYPAEFLSENGGCLFGVLSTGLTGLSVRTGHLMWS